MNILAITCVRDEGPHLLEWIAHHRAAGVGHFIVCSNDCADGTDLLLDRLDAAGIVTHLPFAPRGRKPVQWQALRLAWDHPRTAEADWILVSDCDEFVALREPMNSLQDLLGSVPGGTDAVALPWRLFGSGGQTEPGGGLTIERFGRAAPEDIALPLAHFFKSLFRPAPFRQAGVHRPKRRGQARPRWAGADGTPMPGGFATADGRINLYGMRAANPLVQLNHYSLRTAGDFMLKRARGLPNHMGREIGLGYWVERNFNTVEDGMICHMIPATRAALDRLMAIEDVAALHEAACNHHRERLSDLLGEEENIRLYWQIVLAGDSAPPAPEAARAHLRRLAVAGGADG